MPEGAEVPEASGICEVSVPAKDANIAISVSPPDVLHMNVIHAIGEVTDEFYVVDALIAEVARVVVEAEAFVIIHRFECSLGRGCIEGNLGRVNFEGEVDIDFFEYVKDGCPPISEVFVSIIQILLRGRRKGVEGVPDRRSCEAVNHGMNDGVVRTGIEKFTCCARGLFHFLSGTLADTFRIAVAPDIGGEDGLVALVDQVTDRLADEVIRDGIAGQIVGLQLSPKVRPRSDLQSVHG